MNTFHSNNDNIIQFDELKRFHDMFTETHNIDSAILLEDGTHIVKSKNFSNTCNYLTQKSENGEKECNIFDFGLASSNINEPKLIQCKKCKLWFSKINICIEGSQIATWILGHIKAIDEDTEIKTINTERIGLNEVECWEENHPIPSMKLERFSKIAKLASLFVEQFSQKSYTQILLEEKIAQNKEIFEHQQKSQSLYQAILKASPDDITISDLEGKILMASDASLRMFGHESFRNIDKKNIFEFIHEEDHKILRENIQTIIRGNKSKSNEYRAIKKDGSYFDIEVNSDIIRDYYGEPKQLIFVVRDITERKINHQKIILSEEIHKSLFMDSPDAYLLFTNGIITKCNYAAEKLLVGTQTQIIGKSIEDISPATQPDGIESEEKFQKMIDITLLKGHHSFEWLHKRLDQTVLMVEVSLSFTKIENKTVFFAIWRDLTKKTEQKDALEESERKYKKVFEAANDAIFIMNNHVITDCNTKAELLLKRSKEEILNHKIIDFSPNFLPNGESKEDFCKEKMEQTILQGEQNFEFQIICGDNQTIETELKLQKIELNNNTNILAIVKNITEQKKRGIQLLESERSKSVLISNLPGMAYRCNFDKDWTMQFVSDQCKELTGYTSNELVDNNKISFNDLILPQYRDFLWNTWVEAIAKNKKIQVEYEILTASNEIKWVWEQGIPIFNSANEVVALEGFIIDITERKLMEVQLKETETQYRNLADSGVALIWKSGLDKKCNYFNLPWLKFTGRTFEQEYGDGWVEGVHPDDMEFCFNTYIAAFEKQEAFVMEYRLKHHSGEYKWILDIGTPNYNLHNEFIGYIGHCFDITERKLFEEQINKSNIELTNSNMEKDKFFSIIAHDLRSPFTSFMGLTEILSDELQSFTPDEIKSFAETMKKSAKNLYVLLDNLLEWARMKRGLIPFFPKLIQADILLTNSIQPLIEAAAIKNITIDIKATHISLFADENMMYSVIRNLVSNAIKFTPQNGNILITAERINETIQIQIKDSGIGMDSTIIDNLFKIDKQSYRIGTNGEPSSGLGLILCKEFVEKNNGKIWVESIPNQGSTFYISIPIS